MSTWRSLARVGLFVVPVTITFTDKVACPSLVIGVSMQPLLNPDFTSGKTDWLLQNKMVTKNLKRGDIVTFTAPRNPSETSVKRIIALEGDTVRVRNRSGVKRFVAREHVWVEGDNSEKSYDSNSYGPVSKRLITSKVTHIIWPPSRWQKLDTVELESDRVIKNGDTNLKMS